MRNKTHLLLVVKIQKFTTYAPFLPPLSRDFSRAIRPNHCQPVKSVRADIFEIFCYRGNYLSNTI